MKRLGFGTMRLPVLEDKSIDIEQMKKMVDTFMENGFTYFDTAYPYHEGKSEIAVREALTSRYPREAYQLADKMPMFIVKKAEELPKYFEEQLEKCGVKYFDYYLLHNLGVDRYPVVQEIDAFGYLRRQKELGRIREMGFSFHDKAEFLDQILTDHPEVDFVQLQINYLDWESGIIQSRKNYEVCKKHGKKVIVMEPVKGGTLAKLPQEAFDILKSLPADETIGKLSDQALAASYALRYAASLDQVFMVLSGMSNEDQMNDNISFMKEFTPLTEKEEEAIGKVTEILNRTIKVPCTGCQYCLEVCPISVNIPAYFALMNGYYTAGTISNMYYQRAAMDHSKAMDCLECGQCEGNCPQHIAIRENLKEFHEIYKAQEENN